MKFVNYSAKQARWKCQRNMLWNEWKYSSKKTLNLSHLFFSPSPLSSRCSSLLACALGLGFREKQILGVRFATSVAPENRAAVTDDGVRGGFSCHRWPGDTSAETARQWAARMGSSPTLILASDLLPNDISCVEKQSCSAFRGSEHQLPGDIEHPRGPHSHNKQG